MVNNERNSFKFSNKRKANLLFDTNKHNVCSVYYCCGLFSVIFLSSLNRSNFIYFWNSCSKFARKIRRKIKGVFFKICIGGNQGQYDRACRRFHDLSEDFKCLYRLKYIERVESEIKTNPVYHVSRRAQFSRYF
jgi:hypothetical protein